MLLSGPHLLQIEQFNVAATQVLVNGMRWVGISAGSPATLADVSRVFLPPLEMLATIASFQILSSSSFMYSPTIRFYVV
jgi:hypothetical protein